MPEALITGANKGLGFAAAKALGQAGYHVWVAARSVEDGEDAAGRLRDDHEVDASFVRLDVCDSRSIAEATSTVAARVEALDVLINNAGIPGDRDDRGEYIPPSRLDLDRLHKVFDVNFFGCIDVIQQMLPLLERADAPRIVNVTSDLGSFAANEGGPGADLLLLGYKTSKAAMNMATVLFAKELAQLNIKVNAATPRLTATALTGFADEDAGGRPGLFAPDEGVAAIVEMALIDADGPTGTVHDADRPVAW